MAKGAEARKAKGRGAGGTAGVADEESCRQGDSAEDSSGRHRGEENREKSKGESEELRTTDRSKNVAETLI